MTIDSLRDEKELRRLLSQVYLPLGEKVPLFNKRKRAVVIAGPTGTGKTKLSISLAKAIGGEIISADSMQVYRGMDIGTAKATPEERSEIPHHMIDIRDIYEPFNVVQYYEEARDTLRSISARGNVPIIVGGAGFYLHVFLYGPPSGPPSDPIVRSRIEAQMDLLSPEVMYERLQMMDPEYAKTITERDKHKIVRAFEIITLSEKRVSDFPKPAPLENPEFDFRSWFIYFPKEILYPKIEMRCDAMLEQGFIDEVRKLEQLGLRENHVAAQAIGYKQCLEFLQTKQTEEDRIAFISEFKKASRNYAKRQFTWFRKEPYFRWLNLDEIDFERAQEIILQDFEQGV